MQNPFTANVLQGIHNTGCVVVNLLIIYRSAAKQGWGFLKFTSIYLIAWGWIGVVLWLRRICQQSYHCAHTESHHHSLRNCVPNHSKPRLSSLGQDSSCGKSRYIYLESLLLWKISGFPSSNTQRVGVWLGVQGTTGVTEEGPGNPRNLMGWRLPRNQRRMWVMWSSSIKRERERERKVWAPVGKKYNEEQTCAMCQRWIGEGGLRHNRFGNPCHRIQRRPPPALTLLFRETSSPLFHVTSRNL